MGGENEALLKPDKKNKKDKDAKDEAAGTILAPDAQPEQGVGIPSQIQTIRQHMSAGQVHLHCDAQTLKVAIPVAEWFVIMRHLRSLNPFTWVDAENKCVANLRPYIHTGLFEVAVELMAINVGARFQELSTVTGK